MGVLTIHILIIVITLVSRIFYYITEKEGNEKKADTNSIPGTLVESVYLGEIAQYSLKTSDSKAEKIRISELNPRRVVRDSGQKFFATTEAQDVVILPE